MKVCYYIMIVCGKRGEVWLKDVRKFIDKKILWKKKLNASENSGTVLRNK